MGQTNAKEPPTPLALVIDHFKDFKRRATGYGENVYKGRLMIFVTQEWPAVTFHFLLPSTQSDPHTLPPPSRTPTKSPF